MTAANERWPHMGRWMAGETVDAHLILADAKSICAFLRATDRRVVPAAEPMEECSACGVKGEGWPLCRPCSRVEPTAGEIAQAFASGDQQRGIVLAAEAKRARYAGSPDNPEGNA